MQKLKCKAGKHNAGHTVADSGVATIRVSAAARASSGARLAGTTLLAVPTAGRSGLLAADSEPIVYYLKSAAVLRSPLFCRPLAFLLLISWGRDHQCFGLEKLGRAGYSLRPNRRTSLKLCFLVFVMLFAAASSAGRLSPSADLHP